MASQKRYYYDGPVCEFGKVVQERWYSETVATSEQKARSNLAFQWKNYYGRPKNAKVTIPGILEREL